MSERKVLISPGYGAGWYTWNRYKELLFDEILIGLVEKQEHLKENKEDVSDAFIKRCKEIVEKQGYNIDIFYGGVNQLVVAKVNDKFRVAEYDGYETIEYFCDEEWM